MDNEQDPNNLNKIDNNKINNNRQQQQQQQIQPDSLKPKPITHRSQSSPSSLTTHKFGLRPTPSPPRLIIDHQTGDIIESYPEQPVYLRTYQPLYDNTNTSNINCDTTTTISADDDYSTSNALDLDSSQHTQSCPANNPTSLQKRKKPPRDPNRGPYLSSGDDDDDDDEDDDNDHVEQEEEATSSMGRDRVGFIPPPHAGASKVYFAPPMPSAGHLFHHDDYDDYPADSIQDEDPISRRNRERDRLQLNHHHHHHPIDQLTDADNRPESSTFKRAISKLNESSPKSTTDIALVTHPDAESSKQSEIKIMTTPKVRQTASAKQQQSTAAGSNQTKFAGSPEVVPNSNPTTQAGAPKASKVRYLSTTAEDNRLANKRLVDHDPSIESFSLYSFCYLFRIILTLLLSGLIIYLLIWPLHVDCTKYRPFYTYISVIIASVNLICLVIFSLFWYCSRVTRTLYSNISSSAFIMTIYSILVGVNLAIAIAFFLIGTCHFQRLIATPRATVNHHHDSTSDPDLSLMVLESSRAADFRALGDNLPSDSDTRRFFKRQHDLIVVDHSSRQAKSLISRRSLDDQLDQDQYHHHHQQQHETTSSGLGESLSAEGQLGFEPGAYTMSPWEAGWEYTKEQSDLLIRAFLRFLSQYDLRFIGALHGLCAVCFQYLAIKVAVVRSYYCYSPVEAACGSDYV